ncbi:hypothetical protein [Paraburkholderia fungorum]|uniref:hypothetical protein n=1 Tax=Paraburkholderia fungorum TaxID=134537 RepID=UPI003D6C66FC
MPNLDPATLSEEDRSFYELARDFHARAEALKLAYPAGRHALALEVMQRTCAALVASVVGGE